MQYCAWWTVVHMTHRYLRWQRTENITMEIECTAHLLISQSNSSSYRRFCNAEMRHQTFHTHLRRVNYWSNDRGFSRFRESKLFASLRKIINKIGFISWYSTANASAGHIITRYLLLKYFNWTAVHHSVSSFMTTQKLAEKLTANREFIWIQWAFISNNVQKISHVTLS